MRFNMLQLLKNLRSRSHWKEFTDVDILNCANKKVKIMGRTSHMGSFKDKNLVNGLFFLELLSAVKPRVVNWNLVTKGESDEEKKLNATYIISVTRKLGCCIFLLPEDIMEVTTFQEVATNFEDRKLLLCYLMFRNQLFKVIFEKTNVLVIYVCIHRFAIQVD